MTVALIQDAGMSRQIINERRKLGLDDSDEVWDGVYVMPPLANLSHQDLIQSVTVILDEVIAQEGRGRVQPAANVSDRRINWKRNFRVPDIVVVLKGGRAFACDIHWFGGSDFLVEIQSQEGAIENKIPFYSRIKVQELLIVHRDTRRLRLYRHDGHSLVLVGQSDQENREWLRSQVLSLGFRWKGSKTGPRTEIKRTDGKRESWTV